MYYKIGIKFLSTALLSLVLIGCFGGKSKSTIKGAPKWFEKPPTKSGYIYSTGTARSSDYQQAITFGASYSFTCVLKTTTPRKIKKD